MRSGYIPSDLQERQGQKFLGTIDLSVSTKHRLIEFMELHNGGSGPFHLAHTYSTAMSIDYIPLATSPNSPGHDENPTWAVK